MRLAKFLAHAGVASRRQACRLIEAGRVTLDGRPAKHTDEVPVVNDQTGEMPVNDQSGLVVCVDGKPVFLPSHHSYWLYHKPLGIDCRLRPEDPASLLHLLPTGARVYPAGRLDKDSRGLLLLSDDGELTQCLMHPDFHHPKHYEVELARPMDAIFVTAMAAGMDYGEGQVRQCRVRALSQTRFEIVLTQGKKRQIRRMCRHLGNRVVDLCRTRLLNLTLAELPEGQFRPLTDAEVDDLKRGLDLR
ncbi:pseudouridine synthase [Shewanella sedimentimangrovi]|uniref:Pseudouridine synthase n=1 Tax=Shewanella sedimentimangrovi TaxID=2814293 RepID=A0ABX7QZX7_9GAMM|nr:pseudouridine synthase [Shewanella sedimentimangrovi]QSX36520.1 pseudouridine synthase [Shewanella sedimentimangrovi]